MSASTRLGYLFAVGANVIWGLFPIYWKLLKQVPSLELVCHRIVWALLFALAISGYRFRHSSRPVQLRLLSALRQWKTWRTYGLAALLIAINWLAFLWAVTHDQVLLSSLGYYINPLFNILLGVVVLGERLPVTRWIAVALAVLGVGIMAYGAGSVPWVSLIMASSFAGYALVKKQAKLDAIYGLLLETLTLLVPTLIYLSWIHQAGDGTFANGDWQIDALLILGGFLTLLPLALFSAAAQRVPLSIIGVLQYIGPTLQFIVGAFYFGESLSSFTLAGFAFVWTGVIIFLTSRSR